MPFHDEVAAGGLEAHPERFRRTSIHPRVMRIKQNRGRRATEREGESESPADHALDLRTSRCKAVAGEVLVNELSE
jgi:hypothetical protein